MTEKFYRNIMLNRLVSRSVTQAPKEHEPPTHSADELFGYLRNRKARGIAVEFFGGEEDEDDAKRIASGKGYDFIRIKDIAERTHDGSRYVILLIEFVDQSVKSFPVVDIVNFSGRDLNAKEDERGSSSCHVVIRLPAVGAYDDGSYRCAIEYVTSLTRRNIEHLLSRQLRRHARASEMTFMVRTSGKGKKASEKTYKYHPRLDLLADVGRSILSAAGTREKKLSHLVFTKRSERQDIAGKTAVFHDDVFADVELRISGKQAPVEKPEQKTWLQRLRSHYEQAGFETKVYFRHVGGTVLGGEMHDEVAGAADLMLCAKELIETTTPPRRWVDAIQPDTRDKMIELLERDEIWKRTK